MIVWGCATGVQFARNGSPCWGIQSDGARLRITLGTPVDPLLQIPLAVGEMAVGSGLSDSPAARASNSHRLFSSTTTAGSITARTRSRSHSGRSQCIGMGTAPIFQHPSVASTRCCEFGIASATREPVSAPRAASARPHWLARASSSAEGQRLRGPVERDDGHAPSRRAVVRRVPAVSSRTGCRRRTGWPPPRTLALPRGIRGGSCRYRPTEQRLQRAVRHAGTRRSASASAPRGNRISGWVCRSRTLTSDSSQKPRAPSNWCEVRSTCRAVSAALNRRTSASAERTCSWHRFRSGDGVLGEFMKAAHRDGGIRDGEPDGLEIRQWLAELNPGAHMLGDDPQRLLHCSQNPPRPQHEMKVNVGGRDGSIGCAQRGRHQERPQFGVRPRPRLQVVPVAVQVRGDPGAGQIAVVDARRLRD